MPLFRPVKNRDALWRLRTVFTAFQVTGHQGAAGAKRLAASEAVYLFTPDIMDTNSLLTDPEIRNLLRQKIPA